MKDILRAIFSRGSQNATNDPLVMVGGVDYTSASLTTEVAHYSGGAQLVYSVNAGGTSTSIVSLSGTANVNVVQWGNSNVQSASFGVPTVGWFQRLDQTNDAVTVYQGASNSNWSVVASQSGSWTVAGTISALTGTVTVSAVLNGTMTVSSVLSGTMSSNILGQARTTDPVAAANGAQTPIITDSLGKQVVLPGAVNDLHLDGQASVAGISAVALIPAVAAGRRIAVQSILATCSGSQTVQVIISGGPNNRTFGYAFPGSGFNLNAGGAPLYITSASTALSVAGDVTSTFNVFATGYSLSN